MKKKQIHKTSVSCLIVFNIEISVKISDELINNKIRRHIRTQRNLGREESQTAVFAPARENARKIAPFSLIISTRRT
jgi:hypothetical protein